MTSKNDKNQKTKIIQHGPKDKITIGRFLHLPQWNKCNNGKSAYELWKETVGTGNMNDPKNPGQKWPSDKVSEYDFFNYLAGKDGINGSNGLSAHELWKNDLAKFCGTTDALY